MNSTIVIFIVAVIAVAVNGLPDTHVTPAGLQQAIGIDKNISNRTALTQNILTFAAVTQTGLTMLFFYTVNPAPSADYQRALEKSKQIQALIPELESNIFAIASKENSEIGEIIREKAREHVRVADVIMNDLNSGLIEETMTADKAQEILLDVLYLLVDCLQNIDPDLQKLTENTYNLIYSIISDQLSLGIEYSYELYDYLI